MYKLGLSEVTGEHLCHFRLFLVTLPPSVLRCITGDYLLLLLMKGWKVS